MNTHQLGTDLLCMFCYKNVSAESDNNSLESSTLEMYCRFVKHLYRERSSSSQEGFKNAFVDGIIPDAGVGVCVDCRTVIREYCKLCFQLENIQLNLQWQLERLTSVMKHAGKSPSRFKRFKERILKYGDRVRLDKVLDFRKNVYENCSKKSQRKLPLVILNRLDLKNYHTGCSSTLEVEVNNVNLKASSNSILLVKQEKGDHNVDEVTQDGVKETNGSFNDISENDNPCDNDDDGSPGPEVADVVDFATTSEHLNGDTEPSIDEPEIKLLSKEGRVKFQCRNCPRTFSTQRLFQHHAENQGCKQESAASYSDDSEGYNQKKKVQKKPKFNKKTNAESSESTSSSSEISDHEGHKQIEKKEKRKAQKQQIPCPKDNCQESLKNESHLQLHLKLHGDFSCNFCDLKTNRGDILMDHEFQNHSATNATQQPDPSKVKCSRCERCFSNHKGLYAKRLKHFLGKHFGIEYTADQKCPICGVGFSTCYRIERRLKSHIENVHGTLAQSSESTFNCDICNSPFFTERSRLFHKRMVHKFKPKYECSECNKSFKKMRDLEYHVRKMHKHTMGSFQCSIPGCGKFFMEKLSLEGHIQKHRKKSVMLECSKCTKKFMNEYALKQHMGKHRNQQQHNNNNLKRKIFTVVCELCGKAFNAFNLSMANLRLKTHMNSKFHTSEQKEKGLSVAGWQFSCDTCGKLCQTQFKLDEHLRTHSKEKPFLCTVCGRDFSIRDNLRRHMKLVHKQTFEPERKRHKRTADCTAEEENVEQENISQGS